MSKNDNRTKAHCNRCLHHTNHSVLFVDNNTWDEEVDDNHSIGGFNNYYLLKCAGCDSVRMLHEHHFSEEFDGDGHRVTHRDYYPFNEIRKRPNWGLQFMAIMHLQELINEVYRTLGSESYRLATMGIRALVERIMIEKVGDQGNFQKNIQKFFDEGFVAPVQQTAFKDTLIEAGHAAMHRDWSPDRNDVNTLLDIVEGIISAVYIEPLRAKELGKRITPKTPKSKS